MQSAANVCSIAAPSLHVSQGDFLADLGLQEIFKKQIKCCSGSGFSQPEEVIFHFSKVLAVSSPAVSQFQV